MDTTIDELDKCECVSSVIKIEPVLDIEREKNRYPGNPYENQ